MHSVYIFYEAHLRWFTIYIYIDYVYSNFFHSLRVGSGSTVRWRDGTGRACLPITCNLALSRDAVLLLPTVGTCHSMRHRVGAAALYGHHRGWSLSLLSARGATRFCTSIACGCGGRCPLPLYVEQERCAICMRPSTWVHVWG